MYSFNQYKSELKLKYKFWYTLPKFGLTSEDWKKYHSYMIKRFPIQYRIREFWSDFCYNLKHLKISIRNKYRYIFKPSNTSIRKVISRKPQDESEMIVAVNFAIILQFATQIKKFDIDWSVGQRKVFKKWLDYAANYITILRPQYEQALNDAYPSYSDITTVEMDYTTRYAEVIRLEKLIFDLDSEILQNLIKYREYMWV